MTDQARLLIAGVVLLLSSGLLLLGRALDGRPIHNPRAFLAGVAAGVAMGLVVFLVAWRLRRNQGA